jgi:hypothetical protein
MIESVTVFIIVGAVLFLAIRSLYRTLTGKSDGCGCGTGPCLYEDVCNSTNKKVGGNGK